MIRDYYGNFPYYIAIIKSNVILHLVIVYIVFFFWQSYYDRDLTVQANTEGKDLYSENEIGKG